MSKRSEIKGQSTVLKNQRDRQVDTTYQSRNSQSETTMGTSDRVRRFELQLTNCWRLNVDKSEKHGDLKTQEAPSHRESPILF